MESGAKGCEVIVTGKLRAARAKAMKFKDGYMISSGQPVNEFIDSAVRHVLLRQGCLGIKVCRPARYMYSILLSPIKPGSVVMLPTFWDLHGHHKS
jgi:ribosomal protein S3